MMSKTPVATLACPSTALADKPNLLFICGNDLRPGLMSFGAE